MRRAVVLGGGGLTGVAWLTGVLSAFEEAGIPVGDADLVVGTSAGSVVEALRAAGTTVVEVAPDTASLEALGDLAALDPNRIGPSARAGRAPGEAEAARVAEAWPARSGG
jgi:NTE family protein